MDLERAFSQLKLIKNQKRLLLKDENVSCMMILKNVTRKRKLEEFDSLLNNQIIKKVRQNIDENNQRKAEKKK